MENPGALVRHALTNASFQTIFHGRAQKGAVVGLAAGRMANFLDRNGEGVNTIQAIELSLPMQTKARN